MNQDIKLSTEKYKFKFRVSGILILENKILMVKINNNNFYCLPGGHVELMENTKSAVVREFKEETKIDVKVEKLLYLTENFFKGNLGETHELGFYYLLKPKEKIEQKDFKLVEKDKDGNVTLDFKWLPIENLDNSKPDFLRHELNKKSKKFKHLVILNDKII